MGKFKIYYAKVPELEFKRWKTTLDEPSTLHGLKGHTYHIGNLGTDMTDRELVCR